MAIRKFFLSLLLFLQMPLMAADIFDVGDIFFHHTDDKESIPWGIVESITQDSRGFIWVGTQQGLLRYDGYEFKHFRPQKNNLQSLGGLITYALAPYGDGQLWVGTLKGLSSYDPIGHQFKNYKDATAPHLKPLGKQIIDLIVTPDNELWIATTSGLVYFNPATEEVRVFDTDNSPGLSHNRTTSIVLEDNALWVATFEGISRLNLTTMTFEQIHSAADEPFYKVRVRELYLDEEKILWASSDIHGSSWIDHAGKVTHLQIPDNMGDASKFRKILDYVETGDGQLWLGGYEQGLYVVDLKSKNIVSFHQQDKSRTGALADNYPSVFYKDKAGLIWIGYFGSGLGFYNPHNKAFRQVKVPSTKKSSEAANRISTITEIHDGTLWLGVHHLQVLDPLTGKNSQQHEAVVQKVNAMIDDEIYGIRQIDDGRVYIQYHFKGILEVDLITGKVIEILRSENSACVVQTKLLVGANNTLWIGCNNYSGLLRFDPVKRSFEAFPPDRASMYGYVYTMTITEEGDLWLGTDKGLYYLKQEAMRTGGKLKFAESVKLTSIAGIYQANDKSLWLDSAQGLFKSTPGNYLTDYQSISDNLDLEANQLFGNMLMDDQQRLWGDEGMLDTRTMHFQRFGVANGFSIGPNMIGAFVESKAATQLYGGDSSILMIKPERYQPWLFEAPLVISNFLINGLPKKVRQDQGLSLGPDDKSFSIEVAALDYTSPKDLKYQYKLQGFDSDWIYTDANYRRLAYTNLSPGDYVLQVKASNREGLWSKNEINLSISIQPAWHQTVYFRLFLVLLFLLLLYCVYSLRIKQLKRREIILSKLVNTRTQALRLSLQELKKTQAALVTKEKQAALGRLVRGVAHELNTPLGILKMAHSMLSTTIEDVFEKILARNISEEELLRKRTKLQNAQALMDANIERSTNLVSRFKEVAVESGEANMKLVELASLIRQYTNSQSYFFAETAVIFNITDQDKLSSCVDAQTFYKIIDELVGNSIKHGFSDDKDPRVDIDISLLNDNMLQIKYQDNGRGLDNELHEKIFDPFFSSGSGMDAAGLGLHFVFNYLSQQLQGQVRSLPSEEGMLIVMQFPLKIDQMAQGV